MSYGHDILDDPAERHPSPRYRELDARIGLLLVDRSSGFCGELIRWSHEAVTLRSSSDLHRSFRWGPGRFLLDGVPVTLVQPRRDSRAEARRITASGSVTTATPPSARTARASRIWVEGRHDAELLEHVWGDDLRELGIVVEPMHGADDLGVRVREFAPGAHRRLGVLLDHLVAGSKESRIAAEIRDPHVLITGHPFVDVWAGIRPSLIGRDDWPEVPRGLPWKAGVCEALGELPERFWPRLRNRVRSYADLRPELVGSVERLIDFVAEE